MNSKIRGATAPAQRDTGKRCGRCGGSGVCGESLAPEADGAGVGVDSGNELGYEGEGKCEGPGRMGGGRCDQGREGRDGEVGLRGEGGDEEGEIDCVCLVHGGAHKVEEVLKLNLALAGTLRHS